MTTSTTSRAHWMALLALCLGTWGCEGEQASTAFCVVDQDCPGDLVCRPQETTGFRNGDKGPQDVEIEQGGIRLSHGRRS